MTDDIVARLRCYADINDAVFHPWVYAEAADKIEWMLKEIQQLKHDSTIFINERSDAICENFDLREENAELRDEIERLRAALKHYSCDCTAAAQCPPIMLQDCDCGYVARTTLAGEVSNDAAT